MPSVEAGPSEVSGSHTNQRGPPKEKGARTSGLVMVPRARRPAPADKKALTGDDALEARVHAMWWTLAAIAGDASSVWRIMMRSRTAPERVLADALKARNTAHSTLLKREQSVMLYVDWGRSRGEEDEALLPFREETVYDYLNFCADERAAPTRAPQFLEALHLTQTKLGLTPMEEGPHISGSAQRSLDRKAPRVQRPTLTVL